MAESTIHATTAQAESRLTGACRRISVMWPAMVPQGPRSQFGPRPAPKAFITRDDDDEASDDIPRPDVLLDLRASVTGLLNSWARVLVEERSLTHALPDGFDVVGLSLLIERHARWWSGHEAAADIVAELTQAAHDVTRAVFPHKSMLVKIGPCTNCGSIVRARPGSVWVQCFNCGCEGDTGDWIDALTDAELLRPVTTPVLSRILHRRLGYRVTDRTLRRWALDDVIQPVPEPEIGPQHRWRRYDPVLVMRAVTRLYRACAACGRPWNGIADVCRSCQPLMPKTAAKARPKARIVTQWPPSLDAATILSDGLHAELYGKGRRCEETGSPRAWCLCAVCAS